MKRIGLLFCAAAVAAAGALTGCGLLPVVTGSGVPATVAFDVGAFSNVGAMQGCNVRIVHDTAASLIVTVDDNLVEYLDVRHTGFDSVQIALKQGYMYAGTTFTAEVHVPSLAGLDLSGGSKAVVSAGFAAFPPAVTLSGASTADLQGGSSATLSADLSGGSSLTATGSLGSCTLMLSGGSQALFLGCQTQAASLNMSGGSQCWMQIGTGPLDVAASGGSVLYYRGAPSLRIVALSGGSRLVSLP
jgi:hypothetical protein